LPSYSVIAADTLRDLVTLTLYNFYGATMTFKGRLLLAPLMLKLFLGRKFLSTV